MIFHKTITPSLKSDAGVTTSALNALALPTGARDYFTEFFLVNDVTEILALCRTTAHSGTNPTLDIKFQTSIDGLDDTASWIDLGDAFTQITTTDGIFLKRLTTGFGKWMRARITVGGTNGPTYTVTLRLFAKG